MRRVLSQTSPHPFPSPARGRTLTPCPLPLARARGSDRRAARDSGIPLKRGVIVALRATPSFHRSGGFTLIELVAAFVIFALGFGVLLQILSGALHTTTMSAEYSKAAMWAESLLDTQGIGEPLQEGSSSGRFDDRYSWQLDITRYEPPPVQTTVQPLTTSDAGGLITTPITPLDLFRLDLVVNWGTPYLVHHARFSTVRVMNPPLNAGNNLPAPTPMRGRP